MDRKDLASILSDFLEPLGFKKKGNNWVSNGEEVNRIINLQKSQFGNSFYINYGYIVNSLPLNDWKTHVEMRLGSYDKVENERIMALLDLDNGISPQERLSKLKERVCEQIVAEMKSVTTENDVLRILENRPHLYGVPPFVLDHFNLKSPY